jgi:type III secretion system needle length determinant
LQDSAQPKNGLFDVFGSALMQMKNGAAQKNEEGEAADVLAGSGLLSSGAPMGDGFSAGQAEAVASSSAASQTQMSEIAERILVSMPDSGDQEVRIKIDSSFLADTEVRIVRTESGVQVEFMTDNLDSQRFLSPNFGLLRERLSERLEGTQVSVRMTENMSSGDGNSQDGRSRNRRDIYEETSGE